jgi:hypothetical protein
MHSTIELPDLVSIRFLSVAQLGITPKRKGVVTKLTGRPLLPSTLAKLAQPPSPTAGRRVGWRKVIRP